MAVSSAAQSGGGVAASNASSGERERVSRDYGKLPLSFEANQGQSDGEVRFLSHGKGYSVFLAKKEMVLALAREKRCSGAKAGPRVLAKSCKGDFDVRTDVVRMGLVGASDAEIRGEEELPGKVNYFIGSDAAKWKSDVPTYAKVKYAQVYPGVDLVYYGNQRQLEYDFVVAPGANASKILIRFGQETGLRIAANGDLMMRTGEGTARFYKPVVYQETGGERRSVTGTYRMMARNTVGFAIGNYDRSLPLVIDPVLAYSTFLGASPDNIFDASGSVAHGIAVDADGSAYVVGSTYDSNFPITSHAYQKTKGSPGSTTFVTKFNAAGSALVYSTYLGGSGPLNEMGLAIAIDSAKNAYVTGSTSSTDFPVTTAAYQATDPAALNVSTAFVAKLSSTGTKLLYSTYLGGTGGDRGNAIAVDASGNAFVAGVTHSADFPVTAGAFQQSYGPAAGTGGGSGFVTKLNPDGTGLVYSTFLGGTGQGSLNFPLDGDAANGIAVDSAGNAYVSGTADSLDFPVTSGAYQTTNQAGRAAFITKLNPGGSEEVYSTFISGNGGEFGNGIAIDGAGAAYIAGNTQSSNFPISAGLSRQGNLFVLKLHPDGASVDYANQFGSGYGGSSASGIAVDAAGHAYVTGTAISPVDFPSTGDGYGQISHGSGVVFVVKFDPSGVTEDFATAFGGSQSFGRRITGDDGNAIAVDAAGNVYVAGDTTSGDFPTTSGAFQKVYPEVFGSSAFVFKMALAGKTTGHVQTKMTISAPPSVVPQAEPVVIPATVTTVDGEAVSSGTVWFYSSAVFRNVPYTTLIAKVPVDANGKAVLSDSDLAPGIYHISASYAGDDTHLSTSTANSSPSSVDVTVSARPTLTITLGRVPVRRYGDSNPPLTYTAVGLVSDSPVTITPETTATPASPVGTYPVTATVTGPHADDYIVQVIGTTLTVHPAFVAVVADSESSQYGQTPAQPTGYFFLGLKNGDTAAAISGAPILSTSVVATTPPGYYPIHIDVTGLNSTNYVFAPFAHPGVVNVKKATLTIVPDAITMPRGGPVPTLTYHLDGFISGDTQANSVTGTTTVSTNVRATTGPGTYKTYAAYGTLYSPKYSFVRGTGTLTVLP